MSADRSPELHFCRNCGGKRYADSIAEIDEPWEEDHVSGGQNWRLLKCRGCGTVCALHSHWFSEETDDEGMTVINEAYYPPSPGREQPDWPPHWMIALEEDLRWVEIVLSEVNHALAAKSYTLAAMGLRSIVDGIVTKKAGDRGTFSQKAQRLVQSNLLTEQQMSVLAAAFDAGSAAAHRGYRPTDRDVFTMLDLTESLIEQLYVSRVKQQMREVAARKLADSTPPRQRT